jgi:hypothetical protein
LNIHNPKSRFIRQTIFQNKNYTTNYDNNQNLFTEDTIEENKKRIHSDIVNNYIQSKEPNKILNQIAPEINKNEENIPREHRRILAQLRTNKSPILYHYMNKINPAQYPNPHCPLCKTQIHDTHHLFNCNKMSCSRSSVGLWQDPEYVVSLLARWKGVGGLA